MLKRIDIDVEEEITGFSYKNMDGSFDKVTFLDSDKFIVILSDDIYPNECFRLCVKDIPKMILALTEAIKECD